MMFYYSIYDSVAKEYGPLFPAKNDDVAKRHYKALLRDIPDKEEYKLYCCGSFDPESGQFGLPFNTYEVVTEVVNELHES